MPDFTQLRVWKDAHQLTLDICMATSHFPLQEQEVLASEIYEAAMAIPVSISQGAGLGSKPEFAACVQLALAKSNRLESGLILAKDLGYLPAVEFEGFAGRLARLRRGLGALKKSLISPRQEVISYQP